MGIQEEEEQEEEEEECQDLIDLMDSTSTFSPTESIAVLSSVLLDPKHRFGPTAASLKESAIYDLVRAYCATDKHSDVVDLLTGSTCREFIDAVTKAKCA